MLSTYFTYLESRAPSDGFDKADMKSGVVHQSKGGQEEIGNQEGNHVQLSCMERNIGHVRDCIDRYLRVHVMHLLGQKQGPTRM